MNIDNYRHRKSALAIFPSGNGFGWMLFDGPLAPVDWDISRIADRERTQERKNARCIEKLEQILTKYRPATLVLEEFENGETRRAERIRQLCRSIISLAAVTAVPVRIISRNQIRSCLESQHPKTRYEVAKVVASYIREIGHRLPKPRKPWKPEDPRMALFNAAALLIVHYANPTQPL
jgi:hypothetical protein